MEGNAITETPFRTFIQQERWEKITFKIRIVYVPAVSLGAQTLVLPVEKKYVLLFFICFNVTIFKLKLCYVVLLRT